MTRWFDGHATRTLRYPVWPFWMTGENFETETYFTLSFAGLTDLRRQRAGAHGLVGDVTDADGLRRDLRAVDGLVGERSLTDGLVGDVGETDGLAADRRRRDGLRAELRGDDGLVLDLCRADAVLRQAGRVADAPERDEEREDRDEQRG